MAAAAIPAIFEHGGTARPGWRGVTGSSLWTPAGEGSPKETNKSSSEAPKAARDQRGEELAGTSQPQGFRNEPQCTVPDQPQTPPAALSPEAAAHAREQAALNALALRCAGGDASAWNELARTQHRKVYGICYRFTGSASDAEDCTQDVFLKMYRAIGSFDPARGGFGTWLTTLTRNLLVDQYRRGRNDRATDSLDEPVGGEDDAPSKLDRLQGGGRTQEQHVSGLELRAQIQMALKQVSPELREAVILRDLEDMDYKDIADVLGMPQGTVKSRISRGRAELARLLKRIEGQVM